jgi:hypothetical protein
MIEYRQNDNGSIAITLAISFVALAIAAGVAVDFSRAFFARTKLETSIDSAAIGAIASENRSETQKRTIAQNIFEQNFKVASGGFAMPQLSITFPKDRITITSKLDVPTSLMSLVGINTVAVSALSTAELIPGPPVCVLSLNPTARDAISFQGGTIFTAVNCAVHANSDHASGINTQGGATATADAFCAVGGADGGGFSPSPKSGCRPVPDPFADLPKPNTSGCRHTNLVVTADQTLDPGVYCGGLTTRDGAVVTLQPGIYVIKDGELAVDSHSTLKGDGVFIYFTGNNTGLEIQAQSNVDLNAMTLGDYAGVLFAQDPLSNPGGLTKIQGGGSLKMVGAIYFPTQTVEVGGGGNIGSLSPMMPIVADSILMRGTTVINTRIDEAAAGMPTRMPDTSSSVRLVE